MKSASTGRSLLLLAAFAAPAFAQEWSDEDLDAQIQGFLKPDTMTRLSVMAELVRAEEQSARAIAARIHGDHREYLLKVSRLIDQLTDRRWLEREEAERTLIEIGARARSLLEDRRRTGQLLEERIRCERVLQRIDARGTEKEEQEIQMLRGLVATAAHLESSETLRRSLLSALGHTDAEVRRLAVRALGRHGTEDHVDALVRLLDRDPVLGHAVRDSVARIPGPVALEACKAWLADDALALHERVHLLRSVRQRQDGGGVLAAIEQQSGVLAELAAIELPPARKASRVRMTTPDGAVLHEAFQGMSSVGTVITAPEAGLGEIEVPFEDSSILEFRSVRERQEGDPCRIFLVHGSLIHGDLVAMKAGELTVNSRVFGEVRIPTSEIQGIAFNHELDRLIGASTDFDRIRTRDERLIDGDCLEITAEQIVLRNGDDETAIPIAQIDGILFRRPLQTAPDTTLYTRVDLVSGDRILGHLGAIHQSALGIVAPSLGTALLPLHDVGRVELNAAGGALWGFTLIADYSDNKIVEVNEKGDEVFVMEEIYGAWDVECLDSGNLLITEFSVSRVQEVTRTGDMVWSYEDLRNPYDADRLANGNTLIANTFAGKVVEVDPAGEVVWEYAEGIRPFDVDRLANGNTLIADVLKDRVLEVSADGEVVWEKKGLPNVHDVDRLPNGNTLVTLRTLNRVVELDRTGQEVFSLGQLNAPSDADRLPNGNTLVAENNMVREFDRKGHVVWKKDMTWAVEVNRY